MFLRKEDRTAVFIDGSNLYATSRFFNRDMDYNFLIEYFRIRTNLVRMFYYTAIATDDANYSPMRPLVDWLDYNGYAVVTKAAKEFTDAGGRKKIKGNMDIELAIDMMEMAPHLDHLILFSGDGDFRRLVEAVQRKGKRVTVVSSNEANPSFIADELRRQGDAFVEISTMFDHWCKKPA